MFRNCFLGLAMEHWFVCVATEPGFAGDIGAIEVWLNDFTVEAQFSLWLTIAVP